MNFIDTHAHLFTAEFQDDLPAVVARAQAAGVEHVLLPNIDETSVPDLKRCLLRYPHFFYPMMGLHPTSVNEDWEKKLAFIRQEIDAGAYIALGEIGIDLHWDTTFRNEQVSAFEEQLRWSIDKDLPVSIHFRDATEAVIKSIRRVGADALRGVFHSFGGTKEELAAILALGNFWVGINGVITFKNSGWSDTLKHCPPERVILETDAPYLAPIPYRGKRNESAYLVHIARKLSETWNESEEAIARITSRNARELFGLHH